MEHVIDEIPLMIYKLERFITTLKVRNPEIQCCGRIRDPVPF